MNKRDLLYISMLWLYQTKVQYRQYIGSGRIKQELWKLHNETKY